MNTREPAAPPFKASRRLVGTPYRTRPETPAWQTPPFAQDVGIIAYQQARYERGADPRDGTSVPFECEIGFANGVAVLATTASITILRKTERGVQMVQRVDEPAVVRPLLKHGRTPHIEIRVSGYADQTIAVDGHIGFTYRRGAETVRVTMIRGLTGLQIQGDGGETGHFITPDSIKMNDGTEVRLFLTPRHIL